MIKKITILPFILVMLLSAADLAGQDIHTAVRNGNLASVKAALEEDPGQIEALNASKSTPLIVAASGGHIQVIVVIVGDQDSVDGRQFIQGQGWIKKALGPHPGIG